MDLRLTDIPRDLIVNEFDEYTVVFINKDDKANGLKTMKMSNAPAARQIANQKIREGQLAYAYNPQGVRLE